MEDQDIINEFLIESNENLASLEQQMVELERRPKDPELLAGIFRTMHTIKGTCGFLGFSILEGVAHIAENILNQLRDGVRDLTPELVSLILATVDATKTLLKTIEETGGEGADVYEDLRRRLSAACDCARSGPADSPTGEAPAPAAPPAPPAAIQPEPARPEEPHAVPAPAADADPAAAQKVPSVTDSTIRVDVGLLDKLMNLVGELVLARNQILQFSSRQENVTLTATSQRLNLITTQLQEGVMKTRMQPIGMVWNKLPRVVRDLASQVGKQITLEMDGAETELDKSIIEAIKDPLTHIVRNCCDHGIERPEIRVRAGKPATGRLLLRAYHEGGQVNIEITDDGGGIDPQKIKEKAILKGLLRSEQAERLSEREAVNLLFLPGFSTAERVTSISGRGVGLDVVKTNIEKIGGVVDLASRAGEGTSMKIKIPLTLAIIPGLVVTVGDCRSGGRQERFVIPQVSLLELIRLEGDAGRRQIECIHGTPVYRRRGVLLPIAYLREVLGLEDASSDSEVLNIVVLQAEERQFGLVVDGINDTQEIVVKPLGKQLKGLSCYAGATIMGDGRVALILDVLGVGQLSGVLSEVHGQGRAEEVAGRAESSEMDRQTFLLFRAGAHGRLAVPLALVARLEEFPQSRIERAGGRLVAQYRDHILPLISLGSVLDPGVDDAASRQDPAQVVVFADGIHRVGVVVDEILDIVEDTVSVRRESVRDGLLGSAVLAGKVTDMVDLRYLLAQGDEDWFAQRSAQSGRRATVLVADASPFARGLVRGYLEMAGHRVVEAAGPLEAWEALDRLNVDVVAVSLALIAGGARALIEKMRGQPKYAHIPVLGLAASDEEASRNAGARNLFSGVPMKYDRESMLRSVELLAAALEEGSGEPAFAGEKG